MSDMMEVKKNNALSMMNSIKCLIDQVSEEQRHSKSINDFWSKKYSLIKAIVLECKDMNELNFIKREIQDNELTEESWLNYRRRKKTRKNSVEKNKTKAKIPPKTKTKTKAVVKKGGKK